MRWLLAGAKKQQHLNILVKGTLTLLSGAVVGACTAYPTEHHNSTTFHHISYHPVVGSLWKLVQSTRRNFLH
ncbi:hypothetical protein GQ44DRAFT_714657 [Phaeosphaeriaceae sp. PMI808]|nr:hypothetical protein GQ44DRAFT_714657 [Phaeosphaeriaceae sp. PMI808]